MMNGSATRRQIAELNVRHCGEFGQQFAHAGERDLGEGRISAQFGQDLTVRRDIQVAD
jgi:hypothetical protein